MEQFSECSIWTKTEVIDLPFLPFDSEEDVQTKIINESVKYIRKVKNINFREVDLEKRDENERKFIFYQADTLIGLDISALDASAFSYLDQFSFLMKMYPLVLINSYIDGENSFKRIVLHSHCKERYYILPIFGSIPFLDKALSDAYYGDNIVSLLKGEKKEIDISDFLSLQKDNPVKEIKNRFPQFDIESSKVSFTPQIVWLGVSDNGIIRLLNDLFNNNKCEFDYEEECKQYDINKNELLQYIEKSMLFYKKDNNRVVFRLQRKSIYWGFICNLAAQFEREMIERDAIRYDIKLDQKIGTIQKMGERIYHKLGNLFAKFDAFSYKMFSNIKRILDSGRYTEVLVVDNGNMEGLFSMLKKSGCNDQVYEVLDYFGIAIKIPTIDYTNLKDKSVLVITDIINTGKLIKSVIEILNENKCEKIGIFSFIVNQEFVFKNEISNTNVEFFYLTEKKLNIVENILEREYTNRFLKDKDLSFKLLWGEVGRYIELKEESKPMEPYSDKQISMLDFCSYLFSIISRNESLDKHTYIYQKIKRLIKDKDIIFILNKTEMELKAFEYIVRKEYPDKSTVIKFEEKKIFLGGNDPAYKDKNVLFFLPSGYVKAYREQLDKFIKLNKIKRSDFLDLVHLETYSLDTNDISEEDVDCSYIFQSRLKRFSGVKENPEFNYLKDIKTNKILLT